MCGEGDAGGGRRQVRRRGGGLATGGVADDSGCAVWRLFPVKYVQFLGGAVVVVSLLAFWLYLIDKRKARAGEWREFETTFHLFEV